ncbi:hypothetical protein H4R24_003824 [Coemansia sp. RSA 988]|nr:hypothetical protein H4R24_003824 [Coemansia sp. RSA 988]
MRLFRKSKATQESPDLALNTLVNVYDHQPSAPTPPPPALQLNFGLPLMTPSSLDLGGSVMAENRNNDGAHHLAQIQMQQQSAEKMYETLDQQKSLSKTEPKSGIDSYAANMVPLAQIIGEGQNASTNYNFEYPLQIVESSSSATPRSQGDHVEHQLLEQFGHKLPASQQRTNQTGTTPSNMDFTGAIAPGNTFSNFAYSQPPPRNSSVNQSNQQIMNAGTTHVAFQQLTGSHSSKEDGSSSSEDENAKLNNSMAAMSLGDKKSAVAPNGGLQMSSHALHIQRMREASALGKVAAFRPQLGGAGCDDDDDESDDMPLGGLRQLRGGNGAGNGPLNGMPATSGGAQALALQQQQQYQSHGSGQSNPSIHGEAMGYPRQAMHMYAHPTENPHQPVYQQQNMHSALSASATPYAINPHVGVKGTGPASLTATTASPMASAAHQQHNMPALARGMQTSLHPQMAYNRAMPGAQSMVMPGGMFRSPVAGNSSVTFGNVGLSRAAMAEQSKYMYAPSPLGQMPVYCPPPIMEGPATRTGPMAPPEMHMPHHPASMVGYMPAAIANVPMRSLPPTQQQPQNFQQTTAARNGQEALMNFIPNHERCSGTISQNPLMRDLNKVKQFSAKDYNSRPTLLAEVDSRQLAKRNMPGLGGSTCHSFQPEVPPPPPMQPQPQPQQQQYPPAGYHSNPPARPQDRHDHDTYYSHPNDPHYSSRRTDPARRRHAHHQDPDERGRRYSSSSSISRSKRRADPKTDRSRSSRKHHDHERGHDSYSSEYEGRHVREFRQRKPRQRSRGRSSRGRSHRRRYDDRDYDHFDYDDCSDSYTSEYYNEWDGDSDDYYDDRVDDARYSRRRSSKYRSRGDPGREAARLDDDRRRKQRHGGHGDVHDPWRKPHRACLDDPRDRNRVANVAAKAMAHQEAAIGTEQLIDPHAAQPRSQLGRMLANIKRGAPTAKPPAIQDSPKPENNAPKSHGEDTPASADHDQVACDDIEVSNVASTIEDTGAHVEQTTEATEEEESAAGSGASPSATSCPTPAPVNATIVAAN